MTTRQRDLALGYAWGRRDAAGGSRDLRGSRRFATAYAALDKARWVGRGPKILMGDAWREWRDHGRLTYVTPEGVHREIVTERGVGVTRVVDRVRDVA